MLKELAEYYNTSMIDINHKLIEVAFKKTLAHVEARELEKQKEKEDEIRYYIPRPDPD